MTHVIDPGDGRFLILDGQLVEKDALRIAEAIDDYDNNLTLYCLNDIDATGISDAPFVVTEKLPNGTESVAFEAWALDDRLLERIYNADQRRVDSLQLVQDMAAKKRLDNEKRYKEVREENKEKMLAVFKSDKSLYSLPNKKGDIVSIREQGPVIYNRGKHSIHMAPKIVAPTRRTGG